MWRGLDHCGRRHVIILWQCMNSGLDGLLSDGTGK